MYNNRGVISFHFFLKCMIKCVLLKKNLICTKNDRIPFYSVAFASAEDHF